MLSSIYQILLLLTLTILQTTALPSINPLQDLQPRQLSFQPGICHLYINQTLELYQSQNKTIYRLGYTLQDNSSKIISHQDPSTPLEWSQTRLPGDEYSYNEPMHAKHDITNSGLPHQILLRFSTANSRLDMKYGWNDTWHEGVPDALYFNYQGRIILIQRGLSEVYAGGPMKKNHRSTVPVNFRGWDTTGEAVLEADSLCFITGYFPETTTELNMRVKNGNEYYWADYRTSECHFWCSVDFKEEELPWVPSRD